MNTREVNGSNPQYWHVLIFGLPLTIISVVMPLVGGKMVRLLIKIYRSGAPQLLSIVLFLVLSVLLASLSSGGGISVRTTLIPASISLLVVLVRMWRWRKNVRFFCCYMLLLLLECMLIVLIALLQTPAIMLLSVLISIIPVSTLYDFYVNPPRSRGGVQSNAHEKSGGRTFSC